MAQRSNISSPALSRATSQRSAASVAENAYRTLELLDSLLFPAVQAAAPSPRLGDASEAGASTAPAVASPGWDALPPDVLRRLLSQTQASSWGNLSRVCASWHECLGQTLLELRPKEWPRAPSELARFRSLTAVRLDRLYFDPRGRGQITALLEQLAQLPALTSLTLSKECLLVSQSLRLRSGGLAVTYVMQLPPCISALRCLSHLAIVPFNNQPQHSVNYRTYVRLPAELSALSRLTSLTVHDTMSPLAPPGCCQGLRRLHLHGDTSCDGALAQLSRLSSLQELVMRWSSLGAATTGGGGGDHPLPAARMLSAAVAIPLLQGLTRLEFSYCDLSDSHGINLLHRLMHPNVRHLALPHNRLSEELPASISGMHQLQELDLSSNRLSSLPSEMLALQGSLACLRLRENAFRELPPWLGQLTTLTQLDASCLQLRALPASTAALTNLQRLDVSHTHIQQLPPSLVALQELHMEGCGLAALPPAVQGFTLLRALSLAHNRLASLPEGLRHLAPRLEALDVSFNGLAALPPVLAQLTLLRRLYVQQQRLSAEAVAPLALRLAGQSEPIGEWSCCLYSHCADLPSDLTSLRSLECMGIDTDPHIRSAVLEQLQARKVVVVQSRAGSLLPPGENGV